MAFPMTPELEAKLKNMSPEKRAETLAIIQNLMSSGMQQPVQQPVQPTGPVQFYMVPTAQGMVVAPTTANMADAAKQEMGKTLDQQKQGGSAFQAITGSPAAQVGMNGLFNTSELVKSHGFNWGGKVVNQANYVNTFGKLPGATRGIGMIESSSWKLMGGLKSAGKFMPGPVNMALTVGFDAWDAGKSFFNGDTKQGIKSTIKVAGGVGGVWAGAATGAALGSVVPVVGTVVGGILGAVGGWLGSMFAGKAADAIIGDSKADKAIKAYEQQQELLRQGPVEMNAALQQVMMAQWAGAQQGNMQNAQQQVEQQNLAFNGTTANTTIGAINNTEVAGVSSNLPYMPRSAAAQLL